MKTRLLAAVLMAASTLTLPALADGPGQSRGGYDSGSHERRDDGWRNGGRDRHDYRRDDDWDRAHRQHARYRDHRGPYYYSPRWNSGRAWRDGWRYGSHDYPRRYGYDRYDRRYDHWDGHDWRRTYWDPRGFLYYWDGDLMIRLGW